VMLPEVPGSVAEFFNKSTDPSFTVMVGFGNLIKILLVLSP